MNIIKKKTMKKYFMAGTDDELQFGDFIELDFTKDTKKGTVHHHMEMKFIPELVEFLSEQEIIDIKEIEVKGESADTLETFEDNIDFEALVEDFEALEERVDVLEKEFKEIKAINKKVIMNFNELSANKTAKTSKRK